MLAKRRPHIRSCCSEQSQSLLVAHAYLGLVRGVIFTPIRVRRTATSGDGKDHLFRYHIVDSVGTFTPEKGCLLST